MDYSNNTLADCAWVRKSLGEYGSQNNRIIASKVVGMSLQDAKNMFPSYNFMLAKKRGTTEVYIEKTAVVCTTAEGVITHVTFG